MSSPVIVSRDVLSSTSAAVNSEPVRVAGQPFSIQAICPASLGGVYISNDGQTWVLATNVENTDIGATLASVANEEVKERPEWARWTVATDSSGPRLYRCYFHIRKDNT